MFKPLLALSVFCSGAVPTYSTRSQNTKFISLSQSLSACRKSSIRNFYTLKELSEGKLFFYILILNILFYVIAIKLYYIDIRFVIYHSCADGVLNFIKY